MRATGGSKAEGKTDGQDNEMLLAFREVFVHIVQLKPLNMLVWKRKDGEGPPRT